MQTKINILLAINKENLKNLKELRKIGIKIIKKKLTPPPLSLSLSLSLSVSRSFVMSLPLHIASFSLRISLIMRHHFSPFLFIPSFRRHAAVLLFLPLSLSLSLSLSVQCSFRLPLTLSLILSVSLGCSGGSVSSRCGFRRGC